MANYFALNKYNDNLQLSDDDNHHLQKVLRLKSGSFIDVVYDNIKYKTQIVSFNPTKVKVINQSINSFINYPITLYQACISTKRFEFVIEKATELGISKIVPLKTKYCQANKYRHDIKRFEKIALGAAKQSNRVSLLNISEPIDFDSLDLDSITIVANESLCGTSLIEQLSKINYDLKPINLIIGPEGGFSELEKQRLSKFYNVGLTKTILRSETASLFLISVVITNLLRS